MDFNFNELGLSLSHTIGEAITPYADWFHNKSRVFFNTVNQIAEPSYSDIKQIVTGRYSVDSSTLHEILCPNENLSVYGQNLNVRDLLDNNSVISVTADDIIDDLKTTFQTTELMSQFCDALKGSVADDNLKLSVFESNISSMLATLTASSKNFLIFLRNLMLDGCSTGLSKVRMAINFIKPRGTTGSIESDSSEYTGCLPAVAWGDIVYNFLSNVIPTIINTAAVVVGGIFGVLFNAVYSIGSFCYNALRTSGSSLAVLRQSNRYSDFGVGNDVQWYRIVNSGNANWTNVKNKLQSLTGYNGNGSILCVPMLGANVYIRYDGSYLQIGFRYQLTEQVNAGAYYSLISSWLNDRASAQDVEAVDESYSNQFKAMSWADAGMDSAPIENLADLSATRITHILLSCIAIHLSWYVKVYEEDYNGNRHSILYWYKSLFNPTLLSGNLNWRDDLYYGVTNVHSGIDEYDVNQKTNKAFYLLCCSASHSSGRVDAFGSVQGFDAVGRCLSLWFDNLSLSQNQYFIPHYWLESFPVGAYNIKTDSALSTAYGAIVTVSSIVLVTSTIKIGLLAAKSALRKKAFAARRNADNVAFNEDVSDKDAWKANKRANFLESLVDTTNAIDSSICLGDTSKSMIKYVQSYESQTLNPNINGVKSDIGVAGSDDSLNVSLQKIKRSIPVD